MFKSRREFLSRDFKVYHALHALALDITSVRTVSGDMRQSVDFVRLKIITSDEDHEDGKARFNGYFVANLKSVHCGIECEGRFRKLDTPDVAEASVRFTIKNDGVTELWTDISFVCQNGFWSVPSKHLQTAATLMGRPPVTERLYDLNFRKSLDELHE